MTIMNVDRLRQVKDFSHMPIMPTDIDGYIDYHGKIHILFELKHRGAPVKQGQRLAMERIADDLGKSKPTIYIVADHNSDNPSEYINVGASIVREIRYRRMWEEPKNRTNLAECIKDFIYAYEHTRDDAEGKGDNL